jgi:hypothetical protein
MADLTPQQKELRDRFEGLIGLMAPALDLVLAVGDRISRLVEPDNGDYLPARSGGELPGAPAAPPDDDAAEARSAEPGSDGA